MAITIDDFSKIWASTSPLTPYSFSESNYKEGWNFIGGTPPARQMWDFLQKNNDEKMKFIVDNYLPLTGGSITGDLNVSGTVTAGVGLPPVGSVTAFAGSTTPDGWLLCDGSAVSRTDYAELYSVIGDTYGAGDGVDTFNLPNMSGRVAVGSGTGTDVNSTSKTFNVGDSDGEYTHKLIVSEMPAHHHNFTKWGGGAGGLGLPSGTNNANLGESNLGMLDSGGDAYHNNIQPYTVVKYIIKY